MKSRCFTSYLFGIRMLNVMTARKCLLLVFGFACIVSDQCVAGPIQKDRFYYVCIPEEQPEQSVPMPSLLPRAVPFLNVLTSKWLDEVHLTRLTTPPEFRVRDSKPAKATGVILDAWPPPCPHRQTVQAVHPSAWGQTI